MRSDITLASRIESLDRRSKSKAPKQSVSRAVGDAKLESEGQANEVEGKIQSAIGDLRDRLKRK
jgi:uncharacterized protein YjbJ (UPF0337 family)